MTSPMNFEQLVSLCQRTHDELCVRALRAVDAILSSGNGYSDIIFQNSNKGVPTVPNTVPGCSAAWPIASNR
jgi:hypothetical protein